MRCLVTASACPAGWNVMLCVQPQQGRSGPIDEGEPSAATWSSRPAQLKDDEGDP
jgi:hypothetical protein